MVLCSGPAKLPAACPCRTTCYTPSSHPPVRLGSRCDSRSARPLTHSATTTATTLHPKNTARKDSTLVTEPSMGAAAINMKPTRQSIGMRKMRPGVLCDAVAKRTPPQAIAIQPTKYAQASRTEYAHFMPRKDVLLVVSPKRTVPVFTACRTASANLQPANPRIASPTRAAALRVLDMCPSFGGQARPQAVASGPTS